MEKEIEYAAQLMRAAEGEYKLVNVHSRDAIWTTADGRSYKLKDMADSHVYNALKYIQFCGKPDRWFIEKWTGLFKAEIAYRKLSLEQLEEKREESLINLELERLKVYKQEKVKCNGINSESLPYQQSLYPHEQWD